METTIGQRIAERRKKLKLTQNELAEKLIISNKAVSKWEKDLGYPSFEFLPKLCEILDCSADYLILGTNNFEQYKKLKSGIVINLGKDKENKIIQDNILEFPHLLALGSTGSGKSCFFHSMVLDIINNYKSTEVQLGLIDPKSVEFILHDNVPHLISPIARDIDSAEKMLKDIKKEMMNRLDMFLQYDCTTIKEYNNLSGQPLPYIVVIIDEIAELVINNRPLEKVIIRLTQKGESTGIHIIAGTQRLHSDTLSVPLLYSFPSKACFKVDVKQQSENFFGFQGGENLKGFGDMLYYKQNNTELLNLTTIYYSFKEIHTNLINKGIESHYTEGENNGLEDILKSFDSEIRFVLGEFEDED